MTKIRRLITWNTRHISSTIYNYGAISPRKDQKGTGKFEVIFMDSIPVKHGRLFKSCTADTWMHIAHNDR